MTPLARVARACVSLCTRNLGLKLLSLAFAVSLFALVSGTRDAQRSVYVGIVALVPPNTSDRVLISELPDKVRLTLRGSRSLLQALQQRQLSPVQIDLRRTAADRYYFDLADFTIPTGLTIVQLVPSSIPLVWAKRSERRVRIELQTTGNPPPGFTWQLLRLEPRGVWLRGPEPQLQALRSWLTEPLDLQHLRPGDSEHRLQLQQPPMHSQLLQEASVRVTLRVSLEEAERTLLQQPIILPADHPIGRLRPERVDVVLRGPKRLLESASESLRIGVDARGARRPSRLPVQVSGLPKGVFVRRIDPAEVIWRPLR